MDTTNNSHAHLCEECRAAHVLQKDLRILALIYALLSALSYFNVLPVLLVIYHWVLVALVVGSILLCSRNAFDYLWFRVCHLIYLGPRTFTMGVYWLSMRCYYLQELILALEQQMKEQLEAGAEDHLRQQAASASTAARDRSG